MKIAGFSIRQPYLNIILASAGIGAALGLPYGGWKFMLLGALVGPIATALALAMLMLIVYGVLILFEKLGFKQ